MALFDSTTQYAVGATALVLLTGFLFLQPNSLVKWLQKKNYQYEVTFSLYMLTPTEKFVFNSILFLMVSMFTTMCVLYLPNHIATISRRAFYYFAGDAVLGDASRTAASHVAGSASKASEVVVGAATELAGAAYEAAMNTASAAQEAVNQAAEQLGWS